jgi:hypothetical protein
MMYDALDRMIEQTRGASHTEIVYGPYGMKLALMNGQTLVSAFVKLPGGGRAVYQSTGLAFYRHADHLGNSRLSVVMVVEYLPSSCPNMKLNSAT